MVTVEIKALYSVADLVKLTGLDRHRVRKLILDAELRTQCIGKSMFVPISELRERCPMVWQSLKEAQAERDVAGSCDAGSANAPRTITATPLPVSRKRIKALYSIADLVALTGIDRYRVHRLISAAGICTQRIGKSMLVPLYELRERCPVVWQSLKDGAA